MTKNSVLSASDIPDYHQANRGAISCWVGRTILRLGGWKVVGTFPPERQLIIVAAPHTSNWDFIWGMATLLALDLRCHWMGKHSIFRKPFARFMRWLGGIPVFRDNPGTIADEIAGHIRESDSILLIITPEGTRSRVENWKTGFLRIAKAADCGMLLASLNFRDKEILVGDVVRPGDDINKEVADIKQYFSQFPGKIPENF